MKIKRFNESQQSSWEILINYDSGNSLESEHGPLGLLDLNSEISTTGLFPPEAVGFGIRWLRGGEQFDRIQ